MISGQAVPAGPQDLSAAWLSRALKAQIDKREVNPVGTGQTGATYRVEVTYRGETSLPTTFVVKLASQQPAVKERVWPGYRVEHDFYADAAAYLDIPVPRCYFGGISADGRDTVLVLSDASPATQGDQLSGCSVAQAGAAVDALAGLHASSWCDDQWLSSTLAFPRPNAEIAAGLGGLATSAADTTIDILGTRMSSDMRTILTKSAASVERWLLLNPKRFSLLHGDFRSDNLLFHPRDNRVTVVDWQTLSIGLPARDLAYFLITSLCTEVREAEQHTLVARYHAELCTRGVEGYSLEACWRDYRLSALQVLLISTLGFAFSASTDRGDQMMLAMMSRGCSAITELGTLEQVAGYTVT